MRNQIKVLFCVLKSLIYRYLITGNPKVLFYGYAGYCEHSARLLAAIVRSAYNHRYIHRRLQTLAGAVILTFYTKFVVKMYSQGVK